MVVPAMLLVLAHASLSDVKDGSKSSDVKDGSKSGNMNGDYIIATGTKMAPKFNDNVCGQIFPPPPACKFPMTNSFIFARSQYASKGHEYFDVWSPELATTYGENFWTSMGTHPLPEQVATKAPLYGPRVLVELDGVDLLLPGVAEGADARGEGDRAQP